MIQHFFKSFNRRIFFSLFAIFLLIVIDQMTKLWAINSLMGHEDVVLIKGVLQLHYLENTGAAFSILSNGTAPLILLTLIICFILFLIFVKIPDQKKYLFLTLDLIFLIAGALGNLVDRITNRFVIDFIYFSLIDFPVFNIADIYVTVSIGFLILLTLFYYKEDDLTFLNFRKPSDPV